MIEHSPIHKSILDQHFLSGVKCLLHPLHLSLVDIGLYYWSSSFALWSIVHFVMEASEEIRQCGFNSLHVTILTLSWVLQLFLNGPSGFGGSSLVSWSTNTYVVHFSWEGSHSNIIYDCDKRKLCFLTREVLKSKILHGVALTPRLSSRKSYLWG